MTRIGLWSLLTVLLSLAPAGALADSVSQTSPAASPKTPTTPALAPYKAVYTSRINGIAAEMQQTLGRIDNSQWQLHNSVSIMWVGFEEKAQFSEHNGTLTPHTYHYSNKLSRKRNSALLFDRTSNTVTDQLHSQTPLPLPADALDKLSFQAQLRLDLLQQQALNQNDTLAKNTYHLVDRTKYKTYTIKYLGDEIIATPAGAFNTIKIEQRRPGKDKHTVIWLAKDWDYFVLRIQRIEDGESSYRVELQQAAINGVTIKGL